MKKYVLWVALLLANLVILEFGSAFILYQYWSHGPARHEFTGNLRSSASFELFHRIGRRLPLVGLLYSPGTLITSTPSPLFVPDSELGYTISPGLYQVVIELAAARYKFHATIEPDGSRATSYKSHQASRRLYIFGDSVTWGWPNEDEYTFAWLLQQRLPDYSVRNFAQNGYGNIQALIQVRKLRDKIRPNDIVLLMYANYFNNRNVAAPSHLRVFQADQRKMSYSAAMTYPRGVLSHGDLEVRYVPLLCGSAEGVCDQPEPSLTYMHEVTQAIFKQIIGLVDARIIVGYLNGYLDEPKEKDPVIEFLRHQNIEVADLAPSSVFYENDNLLPFDGHPGPIAQFHLFEKFLRYLETHDENGFREGQRQ